MKTTTAFIFILVAIGLYYTMISPHYDKVKVLQAQANQYSEVLDNVEELTKKRDELLLKYNALPKNDVERIQKALPDHIDTVKLALDFDTIASKYGISIKNIRTSERKVDITTNIGAIQTAPVNSYQTVNVSFSFVSNYDNFRKFVRDIESSLRVIDIRSINFSVSDGGLYEYTLSIDTYWLQ